FGATNNTVSLTNSTNLCVWAVVNTNAWITFTNFSGTGDVTLTYSISANFSTNARTGVVLIGDQLFTLTQRAISNLTFTSLTVLSSNQVRITLSGGPDGPWELQVYPDLLHWQKIGNVTNTTGRVEFIDVLPTGSTKRFYRAVQSPAATSSVSVIGATLQPGGHLKLSLMGGAPGVWDLQGSPDLKQWSRIASLTNTTGTVDFTETIQSNSTKRFYRAVLQ